MLVRLVLIRHAESKWNQQKIFTGWKDVDLSLDGIKESEDCADALAKAGFHFRIAFTSVMRRALHTFDIIRSKTGSIPVLHAWQLNERHYGALQGKYKPAVREEVGDFQFMRWRRSWTGKPPALSDDDPRYLEQLQTYPNAENPRTESLQDCVERVLPYWYETIVPELKKGGDVLIVAHGNSLRGIIKVLDHVSDRKITDVNIPTAIPLVYELDEHNCLRPTKHYYLADPEVVQAKIQVVKDQGK